MTNPDYIINAAGTNCVRRRSDGAWIPRDPQNMDFQKFMAATDPTLAQTPDGRAIPKEDGTFVTLAELQAANSVAEQP